MANKGRYRRNRIRVLGTFQNDLCFYCDKPMMYLDPKVIYGGGENHANYASFDHYISRYLGGSGRKENTVIAHRQCNSVKGHEPSPEYDEKLRLLNIKRGYGDETGDVCSSLVFRRLCPDEFGVDFKSLSYLCDLANQVGGIEGMKLRYQITRRIHEHRRLLKDTSIIENQGLRREIIAAVRRERDDQKQPLPAPFSTLVDNVVKTFSKKAFE